MLRKFYPKIFVITKFSGLFAKFQVWWRIILYLWWFCRQYKIVLKWLFPLTLHSKYFCTLTYDLNQELINSFLKFNRLNSDRFINPPDFEFGKKSIEALKCELKTNLRNSNQLLFEGIGYFKVYFWQ